MMTEVDTHFMERCMALAAIAADRGESPVGSVVVLGGEIIGEGIEAGKARQDVTFHAEVEAVREAVKKHGKDLSAATLYTTHEPCILCSYVIRHHRIGRVVIQTAVAYIGGASSGYPVLTASDIPIWPPPPEVIFLNVPIQQLPRTMHPPTLTTALPRRLLGISIQTSLAENRAAELWRGFRPRVAEIPNRLGTDFFDVKRYGPEMANGQFSPTTVFEKWAAVEVEAHADMPEGMYPLDLPGGLYAVFVHHGPATAFARTYQYIFGAWLPTSGYLLDERPHFDVMGPAYRPDDPEATEEIWIPVMKRVV